jgi:fructosamine-3-kinase
VFDRIEGFSELLSEGIISEYYQLKTKGHEFKTASSSSDRAACFTVEADSREELERLHSIAASRVRVIDAEGHDLIKRELFELK